MSFCTNFPMISIISCLMCGVICSVLKKRPAKYLTYCLLIVLIGLSFGVLGYTLTIDGQFIYQMGHFGAPFGNELRAGILEAVLTIFFCIIMFFSVLAGERHIFEDLLFPAQYPHFLPVPVVPAGVSRLEYAARHDRPDRRFDARDAGT